MKLRNKALLAVGIILGLLLVGTAITITLGSRSRSAESANAKTPSAASSAARWPSQISSKEWATCARFIPR